MLDFVNLEPLMALKQLARGSEYSECQKVTAWMATFSEVRLAASLLVLGLARLGPSFSVPDAALMESLMPLRSLWPRTW